MAPSFGGKTVATKREINILGVGLVGVRLRAAIKGIMEGVITHASNCTAQNLSAPAAVLQSSSWSRAVITNQQDWSFLFSFQIPGGQLTPAKGQRTGNGCRPAGEGKQRASFGSG